MKHEKKTILVWYAFSFILAIIVARLVVYLFFMSGVIPVYRAGTGLAIHHLHFGITFLLLASYFILFHRISRMAVAFLGFGTGLVFDEFVPSLFLDTVREDELLLYSQYFGETLFLVAFILVLGIGFYYLFDNKK